MHTFMHYFHDRVTYSLKDTTIFQKLKKCKYSNEYLKHWALKSEKYIKTSYIDVWRQH